MELGLDDRKLAIASWLCIGLAVLLWKPTLRESLLNVVRAALKRQLLLAFLLVVLYVWAEVLLLANFGLWDGSLVVKTWLWIFTAGAFSVFTLSQVGNALDAVKESVLRNFKISVVFTFVVNLYPLPFWAEFLLIPASVLFVLLQVTAEIQSRKDHSFASVKTLADNMLAIFGLTMIAFAAYSVYLDVGAFARWETLKKFLLPMELSLLFAPLLYFFGVLLTYESLFVRLDAWTRDDQQVRRFLRWMVLLKCNINLRRLSLWSRQLAGLDIGSTQAVLNSFVFRRQPGSAPPPDSFRGLEWGSSPASYMTLMTGPDEEGVALYRNSEEWPVLPLFGRPAESECYTYENGQLYSVMVFMNGKKSFNEGRYELQSQYGPPSFVNHRGDLFRWKWPDKKFEIVLSHQAGHDRVTVAVTNDAVEATSHEAR